MIDPAAAALAGLRIFIHQVPAASARWRRVVRWKQQQEGSATQMGPDNYAGMSGLFIPPK